MRRRSIILRILLLARTLLAVPDSLGKCLRPVYNLATNTKMRQVRDNAAANPRRRLGKTQAVVFLAGVAGRKMPNLLCGMALLACIMVEMRILASAKKDGNHS